MKLISFCFPLSYLNQVPEDLETEVLETQYDLALCRRAIRSKQQDKKDEQVSDVVEAYIVFEEEEAKARALAAHTSHTDFYRCDLFVCISTLAGIENVLYPCPSDIILAPSYSSLWTPRLISTASQLT